MALTPEIWGGFMESRGGEELLALEQEIIAEARAQCLVGPLSREYWQGYVAGAHAFVAATLRAAEQSQQDEDLPA